MKHKMLHSSEHKEGGPPPGDGRRLRLVPSPLLRRVAPLVRRNAAHPLQPGKPLVKQVA